MATKGGSALRSQAIRRLREVEKAKLQLEATIENFGPFPDFAVNSYLRVGDIATKTLQRVARATKRRGASVGRKKR
jgi:hypothetical protein